MVSPQVCNKIIRFSFYALFVSIPLVFTPWNSELFELNKMWITFILTIVIALAWGVKSILTNTFHIQRTPLDLPIALFLLSQFISTLISLDTHTSIWGYYSRFNGGLLSILSYVFLYYAFLSNFRAGEILEMVKKILKLSLITGFIVALWGLPSHFGYDPTCLLFKGSFDVSCWTEDFQPKIRIFSTLGQPAWLGAYLALLIPLTIGLALQKTQKDSENQKVRISDNQNLRYSEPLGHRVFRVFWKSAILFLIAMLFYLDLLYTRSRAAFIAIWLSLAFFTFLNFRREIFSLLTSRLKPLTSHFLLLLFTLISFLLITFLAGTPFAQLQNFSLEGFQSQKTSANEQKTGTFSTGGGGTDSGKIRLYVWRGALDIFKSYPIFGSGVETYAFAYYKFRPVEHNLTSEWNFLYNKAHNEYLNYLATTGLFGLGSYLLIIGTFLYLSLKHLLKIENLKLKILVSALLAGYLSILITNFFGFSVVITNIYLFMIPGFVFVIANLINYKEITEFSLPVTARFRKISIAGFSIIAFYFIFYLANFWISDVFYALGSNLNKAGEYQRAYPYLKASTQRSPFEPTFKDELAENSAVLTTAISLEEGTESAKLAQDFAKDAILTTSVLTQEHPNNLVFWKTQTRVFYTLSQVDERYLSLALNSIKQAQKLAPTDANISFNLAFLYGQNKEYKKAIETLEKTIKMKPDYTNAYYALGLFYHQMATNEKGAVIDFKLAQKAISQMRYILEKLDPKNQLAKEALEAWQQELPSPSK